MAPLVKRSRCDPGQALVPTLQVRKTCKVGTTQYTGLDRIKCIPNVVPATQQELNTLRVSQTQYSTLPLPLTSDGFQEMASVLYENISVIMTPTDEKTQVCM